MAGTQCADFSATPVTVIPPNQPSNATPVPIPGLCRMGPGENAGVLTYIDGRVATIVDRPAGQPADVEGQPANVYVAPPPGDADRTPLLVPTAVASRMQALQGIEFGSCTATGLGSTISSLGFLQTTYNGSPVTWGTEHLREVYRLLGQPVGSGQTANAFICSDSRNAGRLAVNNDIAHRSSLLAAIATLEDSSGFLGLRDLFHMDSATGGLDYIHRNALLQSLRAAAGVPNPPSTFWEIAKYAGGLLGVAVAFGYLVPWISKWLGPKDGGHGGGSGGGGKTVANAPAVTPTAAPVADAPPVVTPRVGVNPLAAGILAMNGGGQPGAVPGVVVPPAINGAAPGVGALPAPIVAVPPVGVAPLPAPVIRVPVGGLVPAL